MNKAFWKDLQTNKVHNLVVNLVNLWNGTNSFKLRDIEVILDVERDKDCEGWEFFFRPKYAKDAQQTYDIYLETLVFVPMEYFSDGESVNEQELIKAVFGEMPAELEIKERG